jgi:hypothetical protein
LSTLSATDEVSRTRECREIYRNEHPAAARPVSLELLALDGRALGTTSLLDDLEGNLAGSLAGILKRLEKLGLTDAQVGLSATV